MSNKDRIDLQEELRNDVSMLETLLIAMRRVSEFEDAINIAELINKRAEVLHATSNLYLKAIKQGQALGDVYK
jgi:hypothetical protein